VNHTNPDPREDLYLRTVAIAQSADTVSDGLRVADQSKADVRFCLAGSTGSGMRPRNEI
jgi:hypothetical protein